MSLNKCIKCINENIDAIFMRLSSKCEKERNDYSSFLFVAYNR